MTSKLFRQEAVDFQSAASGQYGVPTGVFPPSWIYITGLIAGFVAALIVFSSVVELSRKETVRGQLRMQGAQSTLLAAQNGRIARVWVGEGESVTAGDPIIEVATERFLANGDELGAITVSKLEGEQTALLQRRQSSIDAAKLTTESAEQALSDAISREGEARAELAIVEKRLEIANNRATDARQFLAEQLIAEPQLNERLEAAASLEQSVLQVKARVRTAVSDQSKARLDKEKAETNHQIEMAAIARELDQLGRQITSAQGDSVHIVRAPISGKVTSLIAVEGEQVEVQRPLGVVIPEDSDLYAEIFLPSRAIGFIARGQSVKLRYDAFPYQKFGTATGIVSSISESAQTPEVFGAMSQVNEPVYRVTVGLDEQTFETAGSDVSLYSGMTLTASIVLEDRRLFEWLLEPFMRGAA